MGKWDQRKHVEHCEEDGKMCHKGYDAIQGTSKYFRFREEWAQGCALSLTPFKVVVVLIFAVEAAKQ